MSIKIPNETKQFRQVGNSDVMGNIWSSFNLNLTENIGRIRVSPRGLLVATSSTLTNMETPVAFKFFDNGTNERIWCIAGAYMFYNSGDPDDSFTQDGTASTPTDLSNDCDMELFNSALYVAGCGDVHKYASGGTWTTVSTAPNGGNCQMCVYGKRLYATQGSSQIFSLDTADTVVEPTASPNTNIYTLNLVDFGAGTNSNNTITSIRSTSDRIWIATTNLGDSQNSTTGLKGRIFEWNGVNVEPTRYYDIDSLGAMALVIKDDIPYVMDAEGKLLKFNGSAFVEVARLPVNPAKYLRNPANTTTTQRYIHPRGITLRDNKIVMLINNINIDSSTINENLPSGIWEYDENIGLYHRGSVSITETGFSTRKDYAQNRLAQVGALFHSKTTASTDNDGDLMFGAEYYTSATVSAYGVFCTNSKDTVSKVGYLVTTKIDSNSVQDTWQKVYLKYKRLLDSTDRIAVKYRTYEAILDSSTLPTKSYIELTITWSSTTVFTCTGLGSGVSVGDEVEITRGTGGGQMEHILSISSNAGTYTVTLDKEVIGATGTATARFQKWKKIGETTNQSLDFSEFPIDKSSNWIQLKLVMYFTGKNEVNELELVNKPYQQSQ